MTANTTQKARTDTARNSNDTKTNANDIKISTRTLEFAVYVAAVLATIITSAVVGDDASENGVDVFNAHDAMQLITWLTVGLMVARGLAKAGNRDHNHNRG